MRALAAASVLVAALAMPGLLWAADEPPATTTPSGASDPVTTTTTTPAPEPAPTKADAADGRTKTRDLPAAVARASASTSVTIKGFAFQPKTITVNEGDTVTWTNQDSAPHTATASEGDFDTGNLTKGKSGSHKFTDAGTIAYICAIHPNMKGTVVVKAASDGGGAGSSGGSGSSDSSSSDSSSSDSTSSGSDSSDSGSTLANTGSDVATTALVGLLLLGGGALLRRRLGRSGA
jgi:LPXTG-motif cell wall-anchored protein